MGKHHQFLDLDLSQLATLDHFGKRMLAKGDFRAFNRCNAVTFSHQKKTVKAIAGLMDKSTTSVYNWLKLYRAKGINGITQRSYPTKLTEEQVKQLLNISHYSGGWKNRKEFEERWPFRQMARWVKDNWQISISHERLRQIIYQRQGGGKIRGPGSARR